MSNYKIDKYGNTDLVGEYLTYIKGDYTDITIENISSVLYRFCDYANNNDKSMLSFVYQDFLGLFKSATWTQKGIFENRKNIIAGFLKYCYDNNMCTEQYLAEFKSLNGSAFENTTLFKTDYYKDFNELSNLISNILAGNEDREDNAESIGAIYMLWCGLTLEDIHALRNEDLFDYNKLHIARTGRIIEIKEKEICDTINYLKEKKEYTKKVRAKGSVGKMTKGNVVYDNKLMEYPNQDVIFKSTSKSTDGTCNPNKLRTILSNFNKRTNDLDMTSPLYGKVIRGNAIYKNGMFVRLKEIEDKHNIKIEKWAISLMYELDKLTNGEVLNGEEINNTNTTRTTKMISSYLQWRKVYYGY